MKISISLILVLFILNGFSQTKVLPAKRINLPTTSDITISFEQNIEPSSVFPKIYINKSETEAAGNWTLSPANTLTFKPSENWPYNALVTVQVNGGLTSTEGVENDLAKDSLYNFIVESNGAFGAAVRTHLRRIATRDYPQADFRLTMKLTVPTNSSEKMPIHLFVHGGGWNGGAIDSAGCIYSPHGDYLAENLGIATLSISYRCTGSKGNFTLAMEDVITAYQWAVDNAEIYNFDTTKVFFSGGSAGTPLSALASQRIPNVIGYIGFNGIYDFVNDEDSWGKGNLFGQETPSAKANSAIFQLRSNPPATILMHGTDDKLIPYTQSTLFADKINASEGKAHTVLYPGEVHAFFNFGRPAYEDVLIEMAIFMSDILKQ